MNRNIYSQSRWNLYQHRVSRGRPLADVNDSFGDRLEDEIFGRLINGGEDLDVLDSEQRFPGKLGAWAEQFHMACSMSPEFARLAEQTRGNALASAAAVEAVMKYVELPKGASNEGGEKGDEQGDEGDESQDGEGQDGEDSDASDGSDGEAEGEDSDEQQETKAGGAGGSEEPEPKPFTKEQMEKAVEAAEKAMDEAKRTQEEAQSMGLMETVDPDQPVSLDDVKRIQELFRSNRNLAEIMKLAGRFRRIAMQKEKGRTRSGAGRITGITRGNDVGAVHADELARLRRRTLGLATKAAFLDANLTEDKYEQKLPAGQGPIIVVQDKSGSMHGVRNNWATALALILMEKARRERRPFGVIHFNYRVTYSTTVKPGANIPVKALTTACHGGTSFEHAFEGAFEMIRAAKKSGSAMAKADIIFITDGAGYGSDSVVMAAAKELNANIYGLGIGTTDESLKAYCHECRTVSDEEVFSGELNEATANRLFGADAKPAKR